MQGATAGLIARRSSDRRVARGVQLFSIFGCSAAGGWFVRAAFGDAAGLSGGL
jgi:hypothetical protein